MTNHIDVVRKIIAEHPEVDLDTEDRGQIVSFVAEYLNPFGEKKPFGRKSRNAAGTDLNSDALTELLPGNKFRITDILSGTHQMNREDYAQWDDKGVFADGENGFWTAADGSIKVDTIPVPDTGVFEQLEVLLQRIEDLEEDLKELRGISVKYGDRIGLQTGKGLHLCAEDEGVDEENASGSVRLPGNVNATRKAVGPWESLKVVRS